MSAPFDEDIAYSVLGGYTNVDPFGVETSEPCTVELRRRIISRRDSKTSNYYSRKRNGERLPSNYYSYTRIYTSSMKGNYYVKSTASPYGFKMKGNFNSGYPGQYLAEAIQNPGPDPDVYDGLYNRCVTTLLNNMKEQDVNLVQAIAERKQTYGTILTGATQLAGFIGGMKKGNLHGAATSLGLSITSREQNSFKRAFAKSKKEAVAQAWLAYQYGWKPILSDVYGAAKFLARQSSSVTARPTKSVSSAKEQWTDKIIQIGGIGGGLRTAQKTERSQSVKVSVEFYPMDPTVHDLTSLGIYNPATIAWELTPWSFVVDWFIPIGNFINSLDATLGLQFVRGTVSSKYTSSTDAQSSGGVGSGYEYIGLAGGFASNLFCERKALSGFPSARIPSFKDPSGLIHALNGISLLVTNAGGSSGAKPRFR